MSTMSREARCYGELLGAAAAAHVRLKFTGGPAPGWAAWVVQWHDGPTEAQMRALAARVLPRPTPGALLADQLGYCRCLSTVGEATALLMWLRAHPDALADVCAVHLVAARDEVPYPELADELIRIRARALLLRCPSGTVGYEALRALAARARGGWGAVTAWLDAGSDAPIDLGAERLRRRAR